MSCPDGADDTSRYTGPFEAGVIEPEPGRYSGVGRLVLVGKAASAKSDRSAILATAFQALRGVERPLAYLVTPAGFVSSHLPDQWKGTTRSWETTQRDWRRIIATATTAWNDEISADDLAAAAGVADRLVIGVDVKFARTGRVCPTGQTALVIDPNTGDIVATTGKSYPVSGEEESALVRNPSAGNHLTEGHSLGILVCHDLKAFGRPRREARGPRRRARDELRRVIKQHRPRTVVHMAHTTERAGTWSAAWRELGAGSDVVTATAFRYRTRDNRRPRNRDRAKTIRPLRRALLLGTADSTVLTVIVADPVAAAELIDLR